MNEPVYKISINGVPIEQVKYDGGPAFPKPGLDHELRQDGMSLRDWFAGQALAGDMANADAGSFLNEAQDEHLLARAVLAELDADAALTNYRAAKEALNA